MRALIGKGVSPGLAQGKAFVYRDVLQRDSELYAIDQTLIKEEKVRIEAAIDEVRQSLLTDAQRMEVRLGKQSADIFRAQEAILLDPFVVGELKRTVEVEKIIAEQVVRTVFRLLARRFRDMNDEMFRERGDDIDDLSRRLLLSLAGIYAHSLENLPANTVLVARHLLPSDTVFLSRLSTVAVLAEFTGPAAHAALLVKMGLAFGVGKRPGRVVFLVHGGIGFALQLMPHREEVSHLVDIIRHPHGHVAGGLVPGHESRAPI